VLLHKTRNAITHPIHYLILVGMGLAQVETNAIGFHAEDFPMQGMVVGFRGLQQGLGWHATFVQTNSTELLSFHQEDFQSIPGGLFCGNVTGRAGANDSQIVFHLDDSPILFAAGSPE
jgi:hypothetical protein